MSANEYIHVGALTNSCLISANAYRVLSSELEFQQAWLEEITDNIRQRPGHRYMRACTERDKTELWMVPFVSNEQQLLNLQEAMEYVQCNVLGKPHFHFPFDVIEEDDYTAVVMRPLNRNATAPIRKYLPDAYAPRWTLSKSIFHRIQQLHTMGLTSNGISREQLRVTESTWEVDIWLNHTLRLTDAPDTGMRHEGFGSLPVKTETTCRQCGKTITGVQRDIFSAAIWTFYLIMYNHPFLGSTFSPLSRDEYLPKYLHAPVYIMDPQGTNKLSNQLFDREVEKQWEATVPELKKLFDGIFMAATYPETHWNPTDPWWNDQAWLEAIEADAKVNDNPNSQSAYKFNNYLYHLA